VRRRSLSLRCVPLFALLLAAAPAFAAAPPTLVGNWFGTGQPDDKSEMYIDHFLPGGIFRADHRLCHQGKAFDGMQTGRWSLAGDILTIHVATESGRQVERDDVYRVVSLDARKQVSLYLPMNFSYKDTRVDDGFKMPDCDMTS
jgi:hypothetical protein